MDEVRRISEVVEPHYTFLVIDAMTGQDAVATASAFHETLELDGVILTKLDGDARGGAALCVKEVVGRPIAFASTGERLADFDLFHPDRMADRILGMGDVLSLIEQAERELDHDVVDQGGRPAARGPVHASRTSSPSCSRSRSWARWPGILSLLPGVSKELRQAAAQIDDREVAQVEAIIRSMTPGRARRARAHRRVPPTADRPGERHHHPGRQPAPAPVQGDAEDAQGWRPDGRHGRHGRDGRRRWRPTGAGCSEGVAAARASRSEGPPRRRRWRRGRGRPGQALGRRRDRPGPASVVGALPGSGLGAGDRARRRAERVVQRASASRAKQEEEKKGGRVTPPKGR